MIPRPRRIVAIGFFLISALEVSSPAPSEEPTRRLSMSAPKACSKIDGYRNFKTLDEAVLTADEKLLAYHEVVGFAVARRDDRYLVHLREDIRVRRPGEKKAIFAKKDAIDYAVTFDTPHPVVYFKTTVGLKGLAPGRYILDLVMRDLQNPAGETMRSLEFQVKNSPKVDPDARKAAPTETPSRPESSRRGKRNRSSS